jgi:hypothetical protein
MICVDVIYEFTIEVSVPALYFFQKVRTEIGSFTKKTERSPL